MNFKFFRIVNTVVAIKKFARSGFNWFLRQTGHCLCDFYVLDGILT